MSEYCLDCNQTLKPRQEIVTCTQCRRLQHRVCNTSISREQYRQAIKEKCTLQFICTDCITPPAAESTRLTDQTTLPYTDAESVTDLQPVTVGSTNTTLSGEPTLPYTETTVFQNHSSFDLTDRQSFQLPDQLSENSITQDAIESIDTFEAEVTFQLVETGTQRSKRKLVSSDGYTFTFKRQNLTTTEWRCSVRNKTVTCPATVTQNGPTFTLNKDHLHAAKPGILTAVIIQKEIKEKARIDLFEPAPTLVDDILNEHADTRDPDAARPRYNNMTRTVNRVRQQLRPKDPVNMDFDIDTDFIDNITENTPFFRKDVKVKDRRHLIFCTDTQLDILRKAKTWYMDGTFKVVKEPFYQLLTIHAFIKSGQDMKQIPLVYCVMAGKSKKDYKKVLKAIKDMLPVDPDVQLIVADFESGLWRAVQSTFSNTEIQGCAFHWGQAVWRKIQEVGLQTAYTQRDDVYKLLRQVLALPFLPAVDIPNSFAKLQEKASTPQLQAIMTYIEHTWMQSTVWSVSSWSVFGRSIRTNNDVEGWHHRLNRKAKKGNLPFYVLLILLYKESKSVPLHVKMVSEGKLRRYQRKKTLLTQGRLFSIWTQYSNKEISVSRLLKKCASIYGPTL